MYALLISLGKALLLTAGVFWFATVVLHLVPPLGRLVRRYIN